MAENAKSAIRYVHGELVTTDAQLLQREADSRERNGINQIERVMRGEETPANVERDRARLLNKGIAPLPDLHADLKVSPGDVIGKPATDLRALDKVTGRAQYSVDTYPQGMLYTRVLRSPLPHAKVTSIDTSKAEAYPGVHGVITYKDVPTTVARPALTGEPALVGEPVAAVAAETNAIAEEALALIDVQYQALPFVLDPKEALKAGAPLVRTNLANTPTKNNAVRDPQYSYSRGDVTTGFASADLTVEVTVDTSFEQHVCMEPHNVVATWDQSMLTLVTGTAYAHGMSSGVAAELGIPMSSIRVVATDTGGSFGDKTGRHPYHITAALLAKKTGRPVRYEQTRKDIFIDAGHNYPLSATAKLGLKKDGTIVALQGTSYVVAGAYGTANNSDDWEAATHTYKIPNVQVNGLSAFTNTVSTSALRSVGEASGNFMTENLMNRAAEALDMDPLAFRLQNIETKVDQMTGLPYSSCGLAEALQRGADLFNWKARWTGWKKGARDLTKPQKGVGMIALELAKGAASAPMTAIVQIQTDGSILINIGAADIGGGQRTTLSMIAAEAIGVPLDQVKINSMDTMAGPDSGGNFGSRGTKSQGLGVLNAALAARTLLLQGVAAKWNLPATTTDIDIKQGLVFRKSDPTNKTFQMTVQQAANSGVVIIDDAPRPAGGTIVGTSRIPNPTGYSQKTFGAAFYEVEVDPGTGYVTVTEAVQVHDVGRALNPTSLTNQLQGGMMQGINKALTEELIYDAPTGAIVNPNLDEYKLHMLDAMPLKVQVDWVEPYDLIGPYGAKGIGEPPIVAAGPSIHAAIYDAVGVYLNHMPMTPARVLTALSTPKA
ncbi:MAG TPA: molybdopterin cofactor-binding domain-containing protein [Tepidiformaceae bacterium]